MPFSSAQHAKRLHAITIRQRAEALERVKQAALEREEKAAKEMLIRIFPAIPIDDAYNLWKIVTRLTDSLIVQFENGAAALKAEEETWSSLFRGEKMETDGSPFRVVRFDKEYLPVLEIMSLLHNNISQTFTVEHLSSPHGNLAHRSPRCRVTATAPLPS